jgi:glycerophosphoryl diester phosphodiesterase
MQYYFIPRREARDRRARVGLSPRKAGPAVNCRHLLALVPLALLSVPTPPAGGADWPEWSVVFVAHRGGIVPGYPENTIAAFRQAMAQGVQVIEVDLRGTKDGEVVVMHDETVDRTTDGRGPVASWTLAELKQLDAGRGERIPTYSEVLQLVASTGVQLLLDIKQSPVLDRRKVVRLTDAHDASLKVIVGVRTVEDLRTFRALNPNLRTLGFVDEVKDIEAFVPAGVDIIRLWPDWIHRDPGLVKKVQALGKPVWTTAGDASRDELERLIKLGVNGILSDSPAVIRAVVADLKKGRGR